MRMMEDYARPDNLHDALVLLAAGRRLVVAGGTDVYPALSGRRLDRPALDIGRIGELSGITRVEGGIRIGGCTTWAEIAAANLPPALAALQAAAHEVGGRQIQNAGTVAGNICNASPAADGMPPLLVLGAVVEIASLAGQRRVALADFVTGPRKTDLGADEIVTSVFVPESGLAGRSVFLKLGARRYLVISIAMVAARLEVAAGRIKTAAIAVGACSAVARRLPSIEGLLIGAPLAEAAQRISDADVAAALAPIDDIRASAGYRSLAAAELLRRSVAQLSRGQS